MPFGASSLTRAGDVLLLVVDRCVGAEFAAQFHFFVAAGRGDHAGTDRLGHLHDHRADAAGAAVDEQRFAGLQLGVAHEAEVGGDADQRAGGRRFVAHAVGNRIEPALFDGGVFGERALPAQSPWSVPQTRSPTLNRFAFGPSFSTTPARSQPTMNGSGMSIFTVPLRMYVSIGFTAAAFTRTSTWLAGRLGCGQVADDDGFGRAGLGDVGGFHGWTPVCRVLRDRR